MVIGNGFPGSENQSIGLVRALGLGDKQVLYVSFMEIPNFMLLIPLFPDIISGHISGIHIENMFLQLVDEWSLDKCYLVINSPVILEHRYKKLAYIVTNTLKE